MASSIRSAWRWRVRQFRVVAATVRRGLSAIPQLPRWFVLRLSLVTGISPGWWVVAFLSAVVGAVAAVVGVSIYGHLARGGQSVPVPIESEVPQERV